MWWNLAFFLFLHILICYIGERENAFAKIFLIFVLLFVAAGGASADEYTVTAIGNDEITCRFEDNRINAIYKDSDGFVWIGTGATVERVGGRRSLVYHLLKKGKA